MRDTHKDKWINTPDSRVQLHWTGLKIRLPMSYNICESFGLLWYSQPVSGIDYHIWTLLLGMSPDSCCQRSADGPSLGHVFSCRSFYHDMKKNSSFPLILFSVRDFTFVPSVVILFPETSTWDKLTRADLGGAQLDSVYGTAQGRLSPSISFCCL